MKYIILFLILILPLGHSFCQENNAKFNANSTYINYNISLKHLVDSLKLDKRHAKIHVSKYKYLLSIVIGNKTIKSYPIVLGKNPIDDKLREGDRCTPEGVFKIKAKYPHKSWSKFIWFDYPNEASWKKHSQAKKDKKIPMNSTIGGDVGIHGVPVGADSAIDNKHNWTWGCVSLKNKDINEIYDFVFVGMTVEIEK